MMATAFTAIDHARAGLCAFTIQGAEHKAQVQQLRQVFSLIDNRQQEFIKRLIAEFLFAKSHERLVLTGRFDGNPFRFAYLIANRATEPGHFMQLVKCMFDEPECFPIPFPGLGDDRTTTLVSVPLVSGLLSVYSKGGDSLPVTALAEIIKANCDKAAAEVAGCRGPPTCGSWTMDPLFTLQYNDSYVLGGGDVDGGKGGWTWQVNGAVASVPVHIRVPVYSHSKGNGEREHDIDDIASSSAISALLCERENARQYATATGGGSPAAATRPTTPTSTSRWAGLKARFSSCSRSEKLSVEDHFTKFALVRWGRAVGSGQVTLPLDKKGGISRRDRALIASHLVTVSDEINPPVSFPAKNPAQAEVPDASTSAQVKLKQVAAIMAELDSEPSHLASEDVNAVTSLARIIRSSVPRLSKHKRALSLVAQPADAAATHELWAVDTRSLGAFGPVLPATLAPAAMTRGKPRTEKRPRSVGPQVGGAQSDTRKRVKKATAARPAQTQPLAESDGD